MCYFLYNITVQEDFVTWTKEISLPYWIGSQMKMSAESGYNTAVAYVGFSAVEEAETADQAGPHFIGGAEVEVKRVVNTMVYIYIFFLLLSGDVLIIALNLQ